MLQGPGQVLLLSGPRGPTYPTPALVWPRVGSAVELWKTQGKGATPGAAGRNAVRGPGPSWLFCCIFRPWDWAPNSNLDSVCGFVSSYAIAPALGLSISAPLLPSLHPHPLYPVALTSSLDASLSFAPQIRRPALTHPQPKFQQPQAPILSAKIHMLPELSA